MREGDSQLGRRGRSSPLLQARYRSRDVITAPIHAPDTSGAGNRADNSQLSGLSPGSSRGCSCDERERQLGLAGQDDLRRRGLGHGTGTLRPLFTSVRPPMLARTSERETLARTAIIPFPRGRRREAASCARSDSAASRRTRAGDGDGHVRYPEVLDPRRGRVQTVRNRWRPGGRAMRGRCGLRRRWRRGP